MGEAAAAATVRGDSPVWRRASGAFHPMGMQSGLPDERVASGEAATVRAESADKATACDRIPPIRVGRAEGRNGEELRVSSCGYCRGEGRQRRRACRVTEARRTGGESGFTICTGQFNQHSAPTTTDRSECAETRRLRQRPLASVQCAAIAHPSGVARPGWQTCAKRRDSGLPTAGTTREGNTGTCPRPHRRGGCRS